MGTHPAQPGGVTPPICGTGAGMRAERAEARRVQALIHPHGRQQRPLRSFRWTQSSRRALPPGSSRRCGFSLRVFADFFFPSRRPS